MRNSVGILALIFSMGAGPALANDLNIWMVAYKDCHPDLNRLDFSNKPQQCSNSSQAITFTVEGKNIAAIDKESLKLSTLKAGGKDVRHNRKGEDAFEIGAFPKVDINGNYAIFDVNFESIPFGHIGSATLDGSVEIIISDKLIYEEKTNLNLETPFSLQAGPLTISNLPLPKRKQKKFFNLAGKASAGELQNALTYEKNDNLTLYVGGNLDAFVELEVYENGRKLSFNWSTWTDNQKTLSYAKPNGSLVNLTIKYWQGLERITVPIKL